ncbi:MAG: hypothetical protein NTZ05_18460 [Chloroflexi bacterium]|nr:hypothetical protein [Chloroflexota bacterium]
MTPFEKVNTIEIYNELWAPVAILANQGAGTLSLRLVLLDAWPNALGDSTRIEPGQVVHVPVWYGMPWRPSPLRRIPLDEILAPFGARALIGLRR